MPIFNDKHLSWKWAWAKEMYDTAREIGAPLMAGSSLPVTWRTPSIEMPAGSARKRSSLRLLRRCRQLRFSRTRNDPMHGGAASGRRNGCQIDAGVSRRQVLEGDKEGVWPRDLVESALSRSHTLTPAREGFNDIMPTMEDMQRLVKNPVAYRYEHDDGLKSTMLLMSGLVKDFNFAARLDKGILSHSDVSADAGRAHDARELLQSAGEQHGTDVPHRQSHVSG